MVPPDPSTQGGSAEARRDTRRAKELFFDALDLQGPEREAYLDDLAARDHELAKRVVKLLAAHEGASSSGLDELQRRFRTLLGGMVQDAAEDATEDVAEDTEPPAPPHLGDYELRGELASGSAGVVYRARQASLGRDVAVKLLRAGRFASEREVERFRAEAEAVARLDHPRIVPIIEVGECEGRHFFSMKLIEGGSLDQHLPALLRDRRRAARILAEVARAVHHGHQRGILHRDLKPSNILLGERGEPYVADFGIAKHMDDEGAAAFATGTQWFAGTPAYMAPEQAAGRDLTVATDVYALGSVLYELLSGHPPFQATTLPEILAQVRFENPPPITRGAPRDLETIARKCLEKEPRRRYASANALADDLDRWLAHEPILARRTGAARRMWLFAHRRPAVAALAATIVVLVTALAVGASWVSLRLGDSLNQAHAALRASYLSQAEALRHARRMGWRESALEQLGRAAELEQGDDLRDEAIACLAAPDFERVGTLTLEGRVLGVDADGQWAVLRRDDGSLALTSSATGEVRRVMEPREEQYRDAYFGPRGERLVLHSGDGGIEVVELPGGETLGHFPDAEVSLVCDMDAEAEHLVVRDPTGGLSVRRLEDCGVLWQLGPEVVGYIRGAAFDATGESLAVARSSPSGLLHVSAREGTVLASHSLPAMPRSVAWTFDGQIAVASSDFLAYLWEPGEDLLGDEFAEADLGGADPHRPRTESPLLPLRGHRSEVTNLCASTTSPLLVSYGWDGMTILWNTMVGEEILRLSALVVDMSADGRRFLLQSPEELSTWNLENWRVFQSLYGHEGKSPTSGAVSPDGHWLATAGPDGAILRTLADGVPVARFGPELVGEVLFDPRGDSLYLISSLGIQAYDLPTEGEAFDPEPRLIFDGPSRRASISPSGWIAAGALDTSRIFLLHPDAPEEVLELDGLPRLDSVIVSSDDRWVVGGNWGGEGAVAWDRETGRSTLLLEGSYNLVLFASPGGDHLMACSGQRMSCLEMGTWRELWTKERPQDRAGRVGPACFSTDGSLVALAPTREAILIADVTTGRVLTRLESPEVHPRSRIAFGDRNLVITTSSGRTLVWHLDRLGEDLRAVRLSEDEGLLGRW